MKAGVLTLGVLQKSEMWSPCCVGSTFFFDSHARWGCVFCFFQHLCGGNARKTAFLKIPKWFDCFSTLCLSCAGHVAAFFWRVAKMCFPPCVAITFWISPFHCWVVAMRKPSSDLRKCASRPAWRLRFGFYVSIAGLLRWYFFETTRENVLPPAWRSHFWFHVSIARLLCWKTLQRLANVSFQLTVRITCDIQIHQFEFMLYRCAPCINIGNFWIIFVCISSEFRVHLSMCVCVRHCSDQLWMHWGNIYCECQTEHVFSIRYGTFRRRGHHAHEVSWRHRAGSGDWENPKQERTRCIPGLPVVTGPP